MFGFTEDETLKFLKDYDLEYCFPIVHILISWSSVSDHWSRGCKIIGAGPI